MTLSIFPVRAHAVGAFWQAVLYGNPLSSKPQKAEGKDGEAGISEPSADEVAASTLPSRDR